MTFNIVINRVNAKDVKFSLIVIELEKMLFNL